MTITATGLACIMPDFCQPRRGVRHTVRSALRSLRVIGIQSHQVRIERVGGGWPRRTVVEQQPVAGTALTRTTRVVLRISAPSPVDALPYAMRDASDDAFSADRLMALLDAPVARVDAFVAEAGDFLELRTDLPETAWRWIRDIFQLEPGEVSAPFASALARFLPALHRVAGTEAGVEIGLRVLFDLPLRALRLETGEAPLRDGREVRLGTSNGRLGIDAVIGTGVRIRGTAVVAIGPVTLAEYLAHEGPTPRTRRDLLYRLVMPTGVLAVREQWDVVPSSGGPIIGEPATPLRLGVNSRLAGATCEDRTDG